MSAWIVSNEHLAAMVKFLQASNNWHQIDDGEARRLFRILADENARSVNHRYSHHEPQDAPEYSTSLMMRAQVLDPVVILKARSCYEYQSCETDDYYETEAAKINARVQAAAIAKLPGYEEAPWGIDA